MEPTPTIQESTFLDQIFLMNFTPQQNQEIIHFLDNNKNNRPTAHVTQFQEKRQLISIAYNTSDIIERVSGVAIDYLLDAQNIKDSHQEFQQIKITHEDTCKIGHTLTLVSGEQTQTWASKTTRYAAETTRTTTTGQGQCSDSTIGPAELVNLHYLLSLVPIDLKTSQLRLNSTAIVAPEIQLNCDHLSMNQSIWRLPATMVANVIKLQATFLSLPIGVLQAHTIEITADTIELGDVGGNLATFSCQNLKLTAKTLLMHNGSFDIGKWTLEVTEELTVLDGSISCEDLVWTPNTECYHQFNSRSLLMEAYFDRSLPGKRKAEDQPSES